MSSKKELNKRSLAFGANSLFITVLVVGLVGVFNFLSYQYPKKFDLTKNKLHTFSDQSERVLKGLKSEVKAELYGNFGSKEKYRLLFDNYKKLSTQFKLELVDPNKEILRAKNAGIKKMDTLVLTHEGKTLTVDEISEEKVTNALIKLTQGKKTIICSVTGHGEAGINDQNQNGLAAIKKGLELQAYEVKEIVLPQETAIPSDSTAIMMVGTSKALFPSEIKALTDYFDQGGRAIIALEAQLIASDQTKDLQTLLRSWGIDPKSGLIIDPLSRQLNADASVPLIFQYNTEHPVTKAINQQGYFPISRPIDPTSPEPVGIKTAWLAKTSPKAWSESDLASINKGAVQFNPNSDVAGPLNTAVAAWGKKADSKAMRDTRIVVFGSSQFANNSYSRFGSNSDFFLNAVSWAVEDENLISIRGKEDEAGKIELTQTEGTLIFWLSVVTVPLLISILGIIIWIRRKKL
jgi:ABC-type uncharacterized transport system involved in gliding motility auxiliary subunit